MQNYYSDTAVNHIYGDGKGGAFTTEIINTDPQAQFQFHRFFTVWRYHSSDMSKIKISVFTGDRAIGVPIYTNHIDMVKRTFSSNTGAFFYARDVVADLRKIVADIEVERLLGKYSQ